MGRLLDLKPGAPSFHDPVRGVALSSLELSLSSTSALNIEPHANTGINIEQQPR